MKLKVGQYWDITATAIGGCSPASEGCAHCWAAPFAWRHVHNPKMDGRYAELVQDGKWTGKTRYFPGWDEKLQRMKKPQRVLFNCMGDLFHEHTSTRDICRALSDMASMKQHIFILPTKRPREAADLFTSISMSECRIKNLVLLASVENQQRADERIPELLKCAPYVGAIGVSAEPLLGPIDLARHLKPQWYGEKVTTQNEPAEEIRARLKPRIDWVVCGGESGPRARPMHPDWARSLRDQCEAANVPFLFKQWGEWCDREQMTPDGFYAVQDHHVKDFDSTSPDPCPVGHKLAGRSLDGREHNVLPKILSAPATAGREE